MYYEQVKVIYDLCLYIIMYYEQLKVIYDLCLYIIMYYEQVKVIYDLCLYIIMYYEQVKVIYDLCLYIIMYYEQVKCRCEFGLTVIVLSILLFHLSISSSFIFATSVFLLFSSIDLRVPRSCSSSNWFVYSIIMYKWGTSQ